MTVLIALLILLISLWLCNTIDGLPHLLPGLSGAPLWLWIALSAMLLSWFTRDN